ncbi:MAG: glycosyltransferase [Flavobacteriaceae bacterium]|nr:glycosyltransferase [Flavobacteriaceae bacterium]
MLLNIKYLVKENSGPGLSRNYGMNQATGDYFIILDSDCLLSHHYLDEVAQGLALKYTDAFGGPDAAHPSFTLIQKAISYAMTSYLTTGGLRNTESEVKKFQLRSFNMGISKETFFKTQGFAAQNFGEDIEFTNRLWSAGFTTQFLPRAIVYHKRRTSWKKFFNQVYNFGAARPVLGAMYPQMNGLNYWFPALFMVGFITSLLMMVLGYQLPIYFFLLYFSLFF